MREVSGAPPEGPLFARVRLQLFAATWLSYAGFYVCRKVFGVVKGPIKVALGVDDLGVSHLFTVYLVSYMLGQFATAWLGRRFSSRALLIFGMGVASASNLVLGALLEARSYQGVMVAMAIQGAAQAVGWSNNVALMTNWTRRTERGRVMAVWGTCYQLGAVIAKSFAAFLFGWLGLAWSFWGAALVLLALAALFLWWGRESPEACGFAPLEPDAAPAPSRSRAAPAPIEARLVRLIVTMGLIYFSFKFLRYALDSWSALVLAERFGLSTSTAGYLSAVFDWVGFLGVFVAGWWSDRLPGGRRTPVMFAMSVGLLVTTLALWAFGLGSATVFVVLLGVIGLCSMGPDSLLSGAGAMDVGSRRHAVVAAAVINGLGSVGPIVEEPVIGWLKARHGVDAVLLLLVAITALAALSTGAFWYHARRRGLGI